MSKTNYKPRPYFNTIAEEELHEEDMEQGSRQNPNTDDQSDRGTAGLDTQTAQEATSGVDDSTYEKRWKDLKKHYDTEVSALRKQLKDMEEQSNPSFKPPKTAEELEAFRKQYPEFYDVMISVTHETGKKYETTANSRIQELEAKLAEADMEKAFKVIERAHPDYVSVVSSPKFVTWLEEQSKAVQSWVKENSTDAKDFIRALDLYKLDNGLAKPSDKGRGGSTKNDTSSASSAAQDVRVGGSAVQVGDTNQRIWTRDQIDKMSPDEFEKNEEAILEAMLAGRIR